MGRIRNGTLYPLAEQPEKFHLLPSFRVLCFITSSNCIIKPNKRCLAYLLIIKDTNSSTAVFPLNIIDRH